MHQYSQNGFSPTTVLNPHTNPFPPAIPIPEAINPFLKDGVDIFPILLYGVNVPNMKAFVANHMLKRAHDDGRLKGIRTLVEGTSGNTGVGLALVAPYFGIHRVVAVVKRDTAPGKLEQLRLAGADYMFPDPEFNLTPIKEARRLAEEREGWLNLDQYSNPTNPEAHELFTGPHVWEQTKGKLTIFCAGLGTAGTITGASKHLKSQGPVKTLGVILAPGSAIPGVRTEKDLQPHFPWRESVDALEFVETRKSYAFSLRMIRCARMVGPGSGFALAGLFQFFEKNHDRLDEFRNSDGMVVAAFICGDSPFPYLEKYSMALDQELDVADTPR